MGKRQRGGEARLLESAEGQPGGFERKREKTGEPSRTVLLSISGKNGLGDVERGRYSDFPKNRRESES